MSGSVALVGKIGRRRTTMTGNLASTAVPVGTSTLRLRPKSQARISTVRQQSTQALLRTVFAFHPRFNVQGSGDVAEHFCGHVLT